MDVNTCLATTEAYRNLALYSHLVPALAILILGVFSRIKEPDRASAHYFFGFCLTFSIWLIFDAVVWLSNSYSIVGAFWEPLDFLEILAFALLVGFVASDLYPERLARVIPIFIATVTIPPLVTTLLGNAIYEMNQPVCEMVGNDQLALYKVIIEVASLSAVIVLAASRIFRPRTQIQEVIRVALVTLPAVAIMGVFGWSEYVATATDVFEINLYALFSLPLLALFLVIAITSYGTFRLGDMTVKLLFYVFLILTATKFFDIDSVESFLLASMSFVVVLTLGLLLFRSNEREIFLRQKLEVANQQQESLLHFISHEVKGYLTKGQNAFAGIVEKDYGEPTEQINAVAKTALIEMRKGVATVMDILDASNLKKGTVSYKKTSFDIVASVHATCDEMVLVAEEKGLTLERDTDTEPIIIEGDEAKIRHHVIRNLIDNAIRYTQQGTISVSVKKKGEVARFEVVDTGVGIDQDDMTHLFTEGGHGKDSIHYNVDSTGYGLFVAKEVVTGHGGKIWAESKGKGSGSTFIAEFPLA